MTNVKAQIPNEVQMTNDKKTYDLEGIGANYMEADAAESKKDFRHKISLVKKETKETKHWLRMIAKANPQRKEELKVLWNEGQELTLIFSAILKSCNNKQE